MDLSYNEEDKKSEVELQLNIYTSNQFRRNL